MSGLNSSCKRGDLHILFFYIVDVPSSVVYSLCICVYFLSIYRDIAMRLPRQVMHIKCYQTSPLVFGLP